MSVVHERATTRVALNDPLYAEVLGWLIDEAELLDRYQYDEWLSLVTLDVTYRLPVRTNVYVGEGDGISDYCHLDENHETLWVRVRRIVDNLGWAEDPPSRTKRFVSNLRVSVVDDNEVEALSYLWFTRSRGNLPNYETVACERRDRLRRDGESGRFKLASRDVIVDQTSLGITNLSFFL